MLPIESFAASNVCLDTDTPKLGATAKEPLEAKDLEYAIAHASETPELLPLEDEVPEVLALEVELVALVPLWLAEEIPTVFVREVPLVSAVDVP
jgi:hypothetical protein